MSSSSKGFGKAKGGKGGFGGGAGRGRARGERTKPYKNPHDDPFEGLPEPTDDIEHDAKVEVEAISRAYSGFKARAEREKKRFNFAVDADFWCGVCFRSREDRAKFLEAVGVTELYRGRHVDGYKLARVLGLDVDFEHQ